MDINMDFVCKLRELQRLIEDTMHTFEQDFIYWHENSDLLMHFYPILAPLALDLNMVSVRYQHYCHKYEQSLELGLSVISHLFLKMILTHTLKLIMTLTIMMIMDLLMKILMIHLIMMKMIMMITMMMMLIVNFLFHIFIIL